MTHLPMATRFRQLKETYKKSVGVYRSNIHKRGLFCHRDIEAMEMVIEYAGEVMYQVCILSITVSKILSYLCFCSSLLHASVVAFRHFPLQTCR